MQDENPVNPISPVIIVLCLIAVGVELVISLGQAGLAGGAQAVGWRLAALQDYSFSPAVLDWIITRNDFSPDLLKRFITYPFIHGTFTQALFGGVLLLALGKFVGDTFGPWATMAIIFITAVGGAIIFALVASGTTPLYGLFPPVYGLIGAYSYAIWLHLGRTGQNQMAAFRLIGFLLGIQLVFGLIFGADLTWVAELAGFAIGFAVSTVLAPGGWTALLHRMRQRS